MKNGYLAVYKAVEFCYWIAYGLIFPVSTLYLASRGLSFVQIGTLFASFWMLMIVLQVPTGLFADRFGRKTAFIVSTALGGAAWCLHATFASYGAFFASFALVAVGRAIASGATQSWVIQQGRFGNDAAALARIAKIEQITFALGLMAGSILCGCLVLATGSYRVPLYVAGAYYFVLAAAAWRYIEEVRPQKNAASRDAEHQRSLRELFGEATRLLRASKAIRAVIALGFAISLCYSSIGMYWPVFIVSLAETGSMPSWLGAFVSPRSLPGYVEALLNMPWLLGALVSYQAARTPRHHARMFFAAAAVFLAGSFFLAVSAGRNWGLAGAVGGLFVVHFGYGAFMPVIRTYMNRRVPDHIRATALAVYFMMGALGAAIGQYVGGWLIAGRSFAYTWCLCAITFAVSAALIVPLLARYDTEDTPLDITKPPA